MGKPLPSSEYDENLSRDYIRFLIDNELEFGAIDDKKQRWQRVYSKLMPNLRKEAQSALQAYNWFFDLFKSYIIVLEAARSIDHAKKWPLFDIMDNNCFASYTDQDASILELRKKLRQRTEEAAETATHSSPAVSNKRGATYESDALTANIEQREPPLHSIPPVPTPEPVSQLTQAIEQKLQLSRPMSPERSRSDTNVLIRTDLQQQRSKLVSDNVLDIAPQISSNASSHGRQVNEPPPPVATALVTTANAPATPLKPQQLPSQRYDAMLSFEFLTMLLENEAEFDNISDETAKWGRVFYKMTPAMRKFAINTAQARQWFFDLYHSYLVVLQTSRNYAHAKRWPLFNLMENYNFACFIERDVSHSLCIELRKRLSERSAHRK